MQDAVSENASIDLHDAPTRDHLLFREENDAQMTR